MRKLKKQKRNIENERVEKIREEKTKKIIKREAEVIKLEEEIEKSNKGNGKKKLNKLTKEAKAKQWE